MLLFRAHILSCPFKDLKKEPLDFMKQRQPILLFLGFIKNYNIFNYFFFKLCSSSPLVGLFYVNKKATTTHISISTILEFYIKESKTVQLKKNHRVCFANDHAVI